MSGDTKLGQILSRIATSIRPDQAFEAGLTTAAKGLYKTRQKSSHDRQPLSEDQTISWGSRIRSPARALVRATLR